MTATAKERGTTARRPRDADLAGRACSRAVPVVGVSGALRRVRAKLPRSVPAPRRPPGVHSIAVRTERRAARPADELNIGEILPAVAPSAPRLPSALVPGLEWVAGRRGRRVVWGALAAEVAVVLVFALVYRPFDLAIYLWGGRAVRQGLRLYAVQVRGNNWFTYPPFAAALFAPLTLVPPVLTGVAWELGTVAALAWSARTCLRLAGYQPGATVTAAVTAAGLLLEPVYHTLYLGQVNVFLLALVLADIRRAAAGKPAGIGIGLATAIKLVPGLFIVFLLAARRTRDAATAAAVVAACAAAGWLLNPAASRLYWTRLFYNSSRVSATYISNQSPYAALARILGGTSHVGPWYLAISAALALAGLATAARLARHHDWLAAAALTGITGLLVSPISWTHHWVWTLPALLTLWLTATPAARAATAAAWALFVTAPMWFTPWAGDTAQLGFHGATTLAANSFLLAGLAYLTYMTIRTWRPQPASPPDLLVPIMDEATA